MNQFGTVVSLLLATAISVFFVFFRIYIPRIPIQYTNTTTNKSYQGEQEDEHANNCNNHDTNIIILIVRTQFS
jgi:hypothetical protein